MESFLLRRFRFKLFSFHAQQFGWKLSVKESSESSYQLKQWKISSSKENLVLRKQKYVIKFACFCRRNQRSFLTRISWDSKLVRAARLHCKIFYYSSTERKRTIKYGRFEWLAAFIEEMTWKRKLELIIVVNCLEWKKNLKFKDLKGKEIFRNSFRENWIFRLQNRKIIMGS